MLQLVTDPIEVYKFDAQRAYFPPEVWADKSKDLLHRWWTRLKEIPVPDAQLNDRVFITCQVQLAAYHFRGSAWTQTPCSVTTGGKWPFDNPANFGGYAYGGRVLLPIGGENIYNVGASYYRPIRLATVMFRDRVRALPYVVNPLVGLSCQSAKGDDYLDVFDTGQSAVFVELYRHD